MNIRTKITIRNAVGWGEVKEMKKKTNGRAVRKKPTYNSLASQFLLYNKAISYRVASK
jgi:hypothetical protein